MSPRGAFDDSKGDAGVPHCVWRRCRHESLPSFLARVHWRSPATVCRKHMRPRWNAHPSNGWGSTAETSDLVKSALGIESQRGYASRRNPLNFLAPRLGSNQGTYGLTVV